MSRYGCVDLHLHTTYSDGQYSPTDLVARATALEFTSIAVTDHDTTAGLPEAEEAVRKSVSPLRVIPGVEMSSLYEEFEAHILGLFVDAGNRELQTVLAKACAGRRERIHRMVEKLAEVGVDLDAEEVFAVADVGSVGRLHVAEVLMKHGVTRSVMETFQKYLGTEAPAFVPKWYPEPAECCRLIHQAGGVSVLAHPGEHLDRDRVVGLAQAGVRAIECFYPTYSSTLRQQYLDLARELDLGVSGGSDCHGRRKDRNLLGEIRLPEDVVRDLEARRGL